MEKLLTRCFQAQSEMPNLEKAVPIMEAVVWFEGFGLVQSRRQPNICNRVHKKLDGNLRCAICSYDKGRDD